MMCALRLADAGICDVAILERNDRLGKNCRPRETGRAILQIRIWMQVTTVHPRPKRLRKF
ncbi:MAG TPA: FAD-dependent oxidoreductase [Candidatus Borkfalkia excrementavium]|uniref:FAD-dependent oxidoreductase n=1 Tax=Candidatus Borkfalkia excrementavium TaxID=2838505 RepID=A0A9D1Z6Z6_9FIRM|nr:FAD-dependent oxidoreductase [Candidatus Borkfalkia excrementavium]